jgi:ElaB/YqjD/DUF883 family membrane-anchored ribosome-binding protein
MTIQNANQDLLRGSVLPSGSEVESAVFRSSVVDVDHQLPAADDSGLRHKVENLKSRGLAAIQGVQRNVVSRTNELKRSVSTKVTRTNESVRGSVQKSTSQVQQSMREKPMMWAGIAGGTGMALGLIGRVMHWRNHHRRSMPDLVIIESRC